MDSIYSLAQTSKTALLEGVALLSQFYWGPTVEGSRDLLRGTYLKPFEVLKPILRYEPPGILSELKAINTSFSSEDEIFQCLEQTYVRLFINSRDGITAPLYASCHMPGGTPEVDSALPGRLAAADRPPGVLCQPARPLWPALKFPR